MRNTTSKSTTHSRNSLAGAKIDALEPRRMLAVFNGTAGDDIIQITIQAGGAQSLININGVSSLTADPTITINAGEGNDTYNVFRVRSSVQVIARGDGGNDTLMNPASGSRDLEDIYHGELTFEGGLGTDTVVADNSGDNATMPYEMTLTANRIEKHDFVTLLTYSAAEELTYVDNDLGNLISFQDMQSFGTNMGLSIAGRGGNDTIYNTSDVSSTSGGWDSSIGTSGAVVDGGAGTDLLQLRNTSPTTNQYYFQSSSISGAQFPGSGTGQLFYSAIETIDLAGGSHGETFAVRTKPSGTALRADAGGGNDTFIVGDGDMDSNGILLSNTTLLGGGGTDDITFDDRLDNQADGTTSNYTFGTFTIAKGAVGCNYSAFESQSLEVADGTVVGLNTVPIVNLHQTSSEILNTVIEGGPNRAAIVNVANGNLATLLGAVDVRLNGAASDSLNFNAQSHVSNDTYRVSQSAIQSPRNVAYSGVSTLTINAGSGSESFFVDGLPSGTVLNLNANNGNDIVTVGAGNISANMLGGENINGGAGTDLLTFSNHLDTSPATQLLSGTGFVDTFAHNYGAFEQLIVTEGPGGADLAINSVSIPTSVFGGSGDDRFTVGGGDIDLNIPASAATAAPLHIDGNTGSDSIRFNDFNDDVANSDSYVFQKTGGIEQLLRSDVGQRYVNWVSIDDITLDQSNAASSSFFSGTFVNQIDTPVRINGNGGLDQFQVDSATAPVTIHSGLGNRDNLSIQSAGATVIIDQDDDIENLSIAAGATLRVTDDAVLLKTRLTPNPTFSILGMLDLAGGAMLSRAGGPTPAQFRTQITAGHNSGAWDGAGGAINSSLAATSPLGDGVGYGLGSEVAPTSIGSFIIAAGDTLIRYTLGGDINLNGTVNIDDFARLAANFNGTNKVWTTGDSNYDNTTNIDDFSPLAANFNQTASAPAPRPGVAVAAASPFGRRAIVDIQEWIDATGSGLATIDPAAGEFAFASKSTAAPGRHTAF